MSRPIIGELAHQDHNDQVRYCHTKVTPKEQGHLPNLSIVHRLVATLMSCSKIYQQTQHDRPRRRLKRPEIFRRLTKIQIVIYRMKTLIGADKNRTG